jgi:hypothetical protein
VLDAKLLDEARREDTGGERATENGRELGIETSDSHVLELEVGGEDGVWWSPAKERHRNSNISSSVSFLATQLSYSLLGTRLDLDRACWILHKVDLRLSCKNAHPSRASSSAQCQVMQSLNRRLEVLTVEIKDERLSDRENETLVGFEKHALQFVGVIGFGGCVLLEPVRYLRRRKSE